MRYKPENICFEDVLDVIEAYGGQFEKPRNSKHSIFTGYLPNGEHFMIPHSYSHTRDVGKRLRAQWIRESKIPTDVFWETYHTKVKTGAYKKQARDK